jgi:hypothetical protein
MKIGIVCDDYKVADFERELTAAGFSFEKHPFTNQSTTLQVECPSHQVHRVKAICVKVETSCKRPGV